MEKRVQIAKRVSIVTVLWNTVLSVVKIVIGTLGRSSAIVADGIHSMSDVFTTVIAYVGVQLSAKESDDDHQYGHEKFEPVMSKILATVLIVTALLLGYNGIKSVFAGDLETPSRLNIIAAILSIVVKEWMYHYTIKAANTINSGALKADAWHHRTDAFSSIGSLIGVGGALLGFKFLDPLAAVVIALFIIKVGVEIYLKSIDEIMDKSADETTIKQIEEVVHKVEGVLVIDSLKTRQHASMLYVDIEIGVQGDMTLWKAHAIAEKVHLAVEDDLELVKHCMVHVNPYH